LKRGGRPRYRAFSIQAKSPGATENRGKPTGIGARPASITSGLCSGVKRRPPAPAPAIARASGKAACLFLLGPGLELDVILQAHLPDHVELPLQRIDMLLLAFEDRGQQVPAHVIAHRLAVRDAVA